MFENIFFTLFRIIVIPMSPDWVKNWCFWLVIALTLHYL